ncbi:hypothetical protein [Desulforamulus ferrireducens]|uniref:Uncharacterized protein n=1 Tax=Desulforamulus ferrireducens TaxID=1833852 RepID=A0A1S6IZ36_9FIRM|nr:hypothetical protein [Desulforamulus ferrireducens]AQS60031.1 hypothetical protein B0537_13690 [Desulforamulus ferrireducens]
MNSFPDIGQSVFHVRTQKPCIVLGGCPGSRLVTIRFENRSVASVRLEEVVPNKTSVCPRCGKRIKPVQDGVCKLCKATRCSRCRRCRC